MPSKLTHIKSFLGKHYSELLESSFQSKYKNTGLNLFFEQKFIIQDNKTQMVVDATLSGLTIIASGNEILVSKELYEHPNIQVTNSMETTIDANNNPRSLYTPSLFSSVAYLICQNHTMFAITGELDAPIYIKYASEFETFYNSVIVFNVLDNIDIEIVEEFASHGALNVVTNYVLSENSKLTLHTFYKSNVSALSCCLRYVILQDSAKYEHILFGKGSSIAIDESKLDPRVNSSTQLLGCVDSRNFNFNSIVGVVPAAKDYSFLLDHRHIIYGNGRVMLTPDITDGLPEGSHSNISVLNLSLIQKELHSSKILEFINPIFERATLDRTVDVDRFYNYKNKFLQFQ